MTALAAPRARGLLAVYVLLAAFTVSPLLWASVPPLADYPNHLARMWVLTHADRIAELAGNYTIHWRILPYMAMDVIVVALSWLMPVELAGRVFVALTMLSLVGGTLALRRVLYGRIGLWPLASLLFVYNAVLFWGFLSCVFTLGLALMAFAGWIATRNWPPLPRIALFGVVSGLLVLSHLFAFGVYGLLVAGYEAGQLLSGRRPSLAAVARTALLGLQAVPGLALWYLSLAQGGPSYTAYGDVAAKIIAALAPFNFSFAPQTFDLLMGLCAAVFLILALSRRRLHLAPAMRGPLIALTVGMVLMPNWLSASWSADMRLPITLPFVVIASTRLEVTRRQTRAALLSIAAVLLAVRVWSVSQAFADYDRWFTEFRVASAAIAPGARLLVVESPIQTESRALPGLPRGIASLQELLFYHMPALAVIERSAFIPNLFTGWTTIDLAARHLPYAQLIALPMTPRELVDSADPQKRAALINRVNTIGERPFWHDWPTDFDYVFWMSFQGTPRPALANLEEVARGSYFSIYRIKR
jgi:hypothetical protein